MDKCILGDGTAGTTIPKTTQSSAVAPTYDELGKECRGLFNDGYNFGSLNVDFKTKVEDAVDVTAGGSLSSETGEFSGNMSSSYKMKDQGLTFTEKWNTTHTLATGISIEDKLAKGLKLGLDTTFSAETGDKTCKVKGVYRTEKLALTMDVDALSSNGPVISASTVYTMDSLLMGYQMALDTSNTELTKNNFAFGYSVDDLVLHTSVHNLNEYTGSIFRKVNPKLETGILLAWQSDDLDATKFGIGCKYSLDKNITLRAKVDESFGVGLSFQTKIRDGVTCTLSALINGQSFNEGGHKIGVALDLEA